MFSPVCPAYSPVGEKSYFPPSPYASNDIDNSTIDGSANVNSVDVSNISTGSAVSPYVANYSSPLTLIISQYRPVEGEVGAEKT